MTAQDAKKLSQDALSPKGRSKRAEDLITITKFGVKAAAEIGKTSTTETFSEKDEALIGIVKMKMASLGYEVTHDGLTLTLSWSF